MENLKTDCERCDYRPNRTLKLPMEGAPCAHFKPENHNNPLNTQVGGSHYKDCKIQPIEFILENKIGFCEGNAIKYICRHKSKNGAQDIEKAIHYLQILLKNEYGK